MRESGSPPGLNFIAVATSIGESTHAPDGAANISQISDQSLQTYLAVDLNTRMSPPLSTDSELIFMAFATAYEVQRSKGLQLPFRPVRYNKL